MRKFDVNPVIPGRGNISRESSIFRIDPKKTLRLCQDVTKTFHGSEDTLEYIRRVEECLRRLVAETVQIR